MSGISCSAWPASGFAFLIGYWFGYVHLFAIVPAMLTIAWTIDIAPSAAAFSAFGSMLEAAVPIFLLRRFNVDPQLRYVRDTLLYVALGPVIGPMLSATTGSAVLFLVSDGDSSLLRVWLVWWLGNSIGFLLLGGFGLVAVARRSLHVPARLLFEVLLAIAAVVVVTFTGMVIASARQEIRAREQVSWLATHDPLTRLMNRNACMDRLERLLFNHGRATGQHVLMFLDLDRFEDLNDAEGHRAGDQVLRDVWVMLGEEVRGVDTVARLGLSRSVCRA